MFKIVFCLRRKPGMSLEEFQRYWREVHAPLVQRHQRALRIVRYVQLHTEAGALSDKLRGFRDSPPPFDGVAEIWYESRAALETLGSDPAARAASRELRTDEMRFVDLAQSPIWAGAELTVIDDTLAEAA